MYYHLNYYLHCNNKNSEYLMFYKVFLLFLFFIFLIKKRKSATKVTFFYHSNLCLISFISSGL